MPPALHGGERPGPSMWCFMLLKRASRYALFDLPRQPACDVGWAGLISSFCEQGQNLKGIQLTC